MVDITGLDTIDVAESLWSYATPAIAFQMVGQRPPSLFDRAEAQRLCAMRNNHLDYLLGRAIKTQLGGKFANPTKFNRYHGDGRFKSAIACLRLYNKKS